MGKVVFFQKGRAGKVPPRGLTSEQRVWTKPRRDSCTNLGEEHAWQQEQQLQRGEWEHVGCEREISRRQCGWKRENQREEKESKSEAESDSSQRRSQTLLLPRPSFLICKMGIKRKHPRGSVAGGEKTRERRRRESQRQSLVDHRGGHRHCPSPAPSFLICKMGIKNTMGTSLAVQQLSLPGYRTLQVQVQSLVRELRFHMPPGQTRT